MNNQYNIHFQSNIRGHEGLNVRNIVLTTENVTICLDGTASMGVYIQQSVKFNLVTSGT